jgi:dolichyl-phosphate-mannose--protein O-mannosyl transferase
MTTGLTEKRYTWLLVLIVLFGAGLRFWGLSAQPLLDDEVGVAFTAVNYMENGQFGPTMWHHPNLRNIVIYCSGELFGYTPLSLRAVSVLTGVLSLPLMAGIVRRTGGGRAAALLAALLLAVEEVHVVFSRQALQETWTPFLFLLGVYLVLRYLHQGEQPLLLMLAGISFGAGTASKFHAAFPLLVCLLYCGWKSVRERAWCRLLFELLSLSLLPFTVYLLTYLPWFARGYGMFDWVTMQQAIIHKMTTHQGNPMDQIIDREAWQWFLRPMVYGSFTMAKGMPFVTLSWSNPLVWLLVLPATLFQAWQMRVTWRSGEDVRGRLLLVGLFVVAFLPLAVSARPIWLLTALAVLPFAFMLVARSLVEVAEGYGYGRKALIGYALLLCVMSLLSFPAASGKGLHYGYLAPMVERYRSVMEINAGH